LWDNKEGGLKSNRQKSAGKEKVRTSSVWQSRGAFPDFTGRHLHQMKCFRGFSLSEVQKTIFFSYENLDF